MSFDWKQYLTLAQRLARDADEASQRSAISRGYYAAFHTARRYVREAYPEVAFRGHGADHQEVWRCLKQGTGPERSVGHHGDRLRQVRAKADYDQEGLSLPREAAQALEQAERIIRTLQEMSAPP